GCFGSSLRLNVIGTIINELSYPKNLEECVLAFTLIVISIIENLFLIYNPLAEVRFQMSSRCMILPEEMHLDIGALAVVKIVFGAILAACVSLQLVHWSSVAVSSLILTLKMS
ncbi:hypothetical protein L9F63_017861, partial [Diploptera punctata]